MKIKSGMFQSGSASGRPRGRPQLAAGSPLAASHNVEHRKRRSETLRAKLTAFARGERFVDGDGVHTTHS